MFKLKKLFQISLVFAPFIFSPLSSHGAGRKPPETTAHSSDSDKAKERNAKQQNRPRPRKVVKP